MDKRDLDYKEFELIEEFYIGPRLEKITQKLRKLRCKCGGVIDIANTAKRKHEKTDMHQKYLKVMSTKDENYIYKPDYTRSWPYN